MRFIKLTTATSGKDIYINPLYITYVKDAYNVLGEPTGETNVELVSDSTCHVKESAEWIIAEINREGSGSTDKDAGPYYKTGYKYPPN